MSGVGPAVRPCSESQLNLFFSYFTQIIYYVTQKSQKSQKIIAGDVLGFAACYCRGARMVQKRISRIKISVISVVSV